MTGGLKMSALGGLNRTPNGVVIGVVQLQLPVVATPDQLAAQTQRIVAMVGKARRNLPTMDLVVFPEYALHGLSMATSGPSSVHMIAGLVSMDRPWSGSGRVQTGLRRQPDLGLLLDHGTQSRRYRHSGDH